MNKPKTVCDYGMNPSEKAYKCAHDEQCEDCYGKDMEKCPQIKGYTKCDRCATACYCSVERGIECGYKCDCHNPLPQQGEKPCGACHKSHNGQANCGDGVWGAKSPSTWEAELQFDIMEDYIVDAEMLKRSPEKTAQLRGHYEKLKSFIRKTLAEAERTAYQKGFLDSNDASVNFGEAFHLGLETGRNRERAEILARLPKEGENAKRLNTFKEGHKDGWNACLKAVSEAIETNEK